MTSPDLHASMGATHISAAMFDRPIFLLSSPRSGSTLLFETMRQAPNVYSIGGESHALIETVPGLHPSAQGWHSNRLDTAAATATIAAELKRRFRANLRDREGRAPPAFQPVRMIEKTPKNSLRVPFLQAIFPKAIFVFLYRDWRQTLSSMIEAWKSGRFVTYPHLPDWPPPAWSLLLTPGWQGLRGLPIAEIAARQWSTTLEILLDDLETLPPERIIAIDYEQLIAAPDSMMHALCGATGLKWDRMLESQLPLSPTTVSAPAHDKWQRHEREILAVEPLVTGIETRARAFLNRQAVASTRPS